MLDVDLLYSILKNAVRKELNYIETAIEINNEKIIFLRLNWNLQRILTIIYL